MLVAAIAAGGQSGATSAAAAKAGRSDPASFRTHIAPVSAVAPADLRIEVLVEPGEDNRALDIVVDAIDYYRGSVIPLDGARAARLHTVEYRGMPAGTYSVLIRLRARQGVSRTTQHTFYVVQ